jgi:hypothetical protein
MQPFERLRSLARWQGGDTSELVSEAADCLAGFADDPAGLVVACRRLLVHHPATGMLWWLCARVLTASDAANAAWDSWQRVHDDPTPGRLAERLPFPHDDVVAVLGWPDGCAAALSSRPDLDAVAIRTNDRWLHTRLRRADATVRVVDEVDALALEPSHLLVEAGAASASGEAVVAAGTSQLLADLPAAESWLVVGVGHALPDRLVASLRRQLDERDDGDVEVLEASRFARLAGPTGVDDPSTLPRLVDCPIAPELLRLG